MIAAAPHPARDPDGFHVWALRYLEGGLSPDEERAFENLLESSEEACRTFAEAAQQDADLFELRRSSTFTDAAPFARARTSRRRIAVWATRRRGRHPARRAWLPLVGAAGILLTVSLLATFGRPPSGGPTRKETVSLVEVDSTIPDEAANPRREARRAPAGRKRPASDPQSPGNLPSGIPTGRPGEPDSEDPAPGPHDESRPEASLVSGLRDEPAKRPTAVSPEGPPIPGIVIDRVEGEVCVIGGPQRNPAESGRPLAPGQGLETGPQGGAALRFPDGTRLELGPQTLLREIGDLERPAPGRISRGKRVTLSHGRLASDVVRQPADRPMSIVTPQSEVKVLGTRLTIEAGAESTRVEVEEGRVRVTRLPDGAAVEISSGRHAVVSPGVPLAARPRERLIWRFDFEDGRTPATLLEGRPAPGPPRSGNRFALESSDYIARDYGPAVNFRLDERLGTEPGNLRLRFRYFAAAGGKMHVQFFNETAGDNFSVAISDLIPGRWAWADLPLSYFAKNTDRTRFLRKGDHLVFLGMFVVARGGPSVYWDDIELVEIPGR